MIFVVGDKKILTLLRACSKTNKAIDIAGINHFLRQSTVPKKVSKGKIACTSLSKKIK